MPLSAQSGHRPQARLCELPRSGEVWRSLEEICAQWAERPTPVGAAAASIAPPATVWKTNASTRTIERNHRQTITAPNPLRRRKLHIRRTCQAATTRMVADFKIFLTCDNFATFGRFGAPGVAARRLFCPSASRALAKSLAFGPRRRYSRTTGLTPRSKSVSVV